MYVSVDTFVSNRNKLAQLSRKGIYFVVHLMNKKPAVESNMQICLFWSWEKQNYSLISGVEHRT